MDSSGVRNPRDGTEPIHLSSSVKAAPATVRPIPAPRRKNRNQPTNSSRSGVRQAPPPSDDDVLAYDATPVERLVIESDELAQEIPANSSEWGTAPSRKESFKQPVAEPPTDFDAVHFVPSTPTLLTCSDEMLLAYVPFSTLRIEPSPALTLDHRKRSSARDRRSRVEGRLRSSGSVDYDLDNLDTPTRKEVARSSSTPLLNSEVDDDNIQHNSAVDVAMVQKLNTFFGESKQTATELEANIYKSLVMGRSVQVSETNVVAQNCKSKKTLSSSAWSLASKLATSNVSLSTKQKKSQQQQEDKQPPEAFQRSKERRSLRGRVAALMRHGVTGQTSGDQLPAAPKTFGIALHLCVMSCTYELVPLIVEVCIGIIEERGLDSQGIYRIPGNTAVVHELQEQLDKSPLLNVDGELWRDVNVVASLLKLFFRKLPKSLLTSEQYDKLLEANRCPNSDDRLLQLKSLLDKLPECNYNTLRFLMRHLHRVAAEHDVNKMDSYNLAIMFGPALVRPSDDDDMTRMLKDMADQSQIVDSLIKHYKWFFSDDDQVPEDIDIDTATSPQLLPSAENIVEIQIAREEMSNRSRGVAHKSRKHSGNDVTPDGLLDDGHKGAQAYLLAKLRETETRVINAVRLATPSGGKRTHTRVAIEHTSNKALGGGTTVGGETRLGAGLGGTGLVGVPGLVGVGQTGGAEPRWLAEPEKDELSDFDNSSDDEVLPSGGNIGVSRYPAYHYDPYGTLYSLTDGTRPLTLERNTIKSASADCLAEGGHSLEAESEVGRGVERGGERERGGSEERVRRSRRRSVRKEMRSSDGQRTDRVDSEVTEASSNERGACDGRRGSSPGLDRPSPPKPKPRLPPKPKPVAATEDCSQSVVNTEADGRKVRPAVNKDQALMLSQLSSVLKQRNNVEDSG